MLFFRETDKLSTIVFLLVLVSRGLSCLSPVYNLVLQSIFSETSDCPSAFRGLLFQVDNSNELTNKITDILSKVSKVARMTPR